MALPFDAILWDNDGILVDSEFLYYEFTRDALAGLGVDLKVSDYQEINLRQGKNVFMLAEAIGVSADVIARTKEERNVLFRKRIVEGVEIIEGVKETLQTLHGRIPMAVVTSSHPENLESMHSDHELEGFFETVVAAGATPRFKPHPDPDLLAAERLSVSPDRCLVVEDSERGLQAAVAAGMRCAVIPKELTRVGDFSTASFVLESVREIPPIVLPDGA
ncbi:MAG: HAD family phosphatase [Myxococcota bacterium]|nr:HAD family phosphatase [Myxococcota bacterium]